MALDQQTKAGVICTIVIVVATALGLWLTRDYRPGRDADRRTQETIAECRAAGGVPILNQFGTLVLRCER